VARLVVFDLDGTLVDSSRDLASATNAALARVAPGTPAIPVETVIGFVGEGARLLVERSLRHAGLALEPDDVLPAFFECYSERLLETTRLYPGMAEALGALAAARGAGDVAQRKPDPAGLLQLVAELGSSPEEAWLVGDSAVDVRTGRAAGVRVAGVAWGLDPAGMRAAGPDRQLASPAELAALVAA